jgi:hypothetical protein
MNRLILRSLVTALLLLVLLSVPSIASADSTNSVLWTITGVPGVTGSFMFNGTTYSDIHVSTPLNPAPPGYTGLWADPGVTPTATGVAFGSTNPLDLSGPVLVLMFSGLGLGTTPGTVSLVPGAPDLSTGSGEFICTDALCNGFTTPVPITAPGAEVVGTAVVTPEPSALWLFSMGLLTLLAGVSIRKVLHP